MIDNLKYRHEYKYLCTAAELEILKNRLNGFLSIDKHASDKGYCVRSMYFDSYSNHCFFENENGTDLRKKYRIRIYNADPSRISLEQKSKVHGKTHKRSCLLSIEQYNNLVYDDTISVHVKNDPLLNKFLVLKQTQLMKPAVIVEYDRIPYVYADGNVRITLDMNIRSSLSFPDFFCSTLPSRLILPSGQHLLEVKFDEILPPFIKEVINLDSLKHTTFSKYYLCRKFTTGDIL